MPDLCGVWPAYWLLGDDPSPRIGKLTTWKNVGGGKNKKVNAHTHTALHTEHSCHVALGMAK